MNPLRALIEAAIIEWLDGRQLPSAHPDDDWYANPVKLLGLAPVVRAAFIEDVVYIKFEDRHHPGTSAYRYEGTLAQLLFEVVGLTT